MRRTTFSATVAVSTLASASASPSSAFDVLLSLAADAAPKVAPSRR